MMIQSKTIYACPTAAGSRQGHGVGAEVRRFVTRLHGQTTPLIDGERPDHSGKLVAMFCPSPSHTPATVPTRHGFFFGAIRVRMMTYKQLGEIGMRVPLHPAGGREISLIILFFGGLAAVAFGLGFAGFSWFWTIGIVALLHGAAGVAFFRDPERTTPDEPGILVAPADGKLVETTALDHHPDIGGPATLIGIFLSVFNVHVNRSPCAGVVRAIRYEPGQFLDARNSQSSAKNEANTLIIEPDEPMGGPVVVRQIAGLIARRVICTLKVGDRVEIGQRIGLIKFGSRTELIVPGHDRFQVVAPMGRQVRGASTILARRQTAVEPARPVRQTAEVG